MKHMTTVTLFFLVILIPIFFTLTLSQKCNPYDQNILLKLKAQLGNPPHLDRYWTPTTNCCSEWETRINCDAHGHVTSLTLGLSDDIAGPIPPIIGQLSFLRELQLLNRNISGPIPLALCNLKDLETLTIQETGMSGPIPKCLGRLINLTDFGIYFNYRVTGPIPDSLGNLTNLIYLRLQANNISGSIPGSLVRMRSLEWFNFESNRITGSIPPSLGLIHNLSFIMMANNQLSGSIPKSLGLLKKLTWLDLHGNQLSGPIPKSLGRTNAYFMDLSSNRLVGGPSFLFDRNKTDTSDVNLSNNRFKFNFSNVEISTSLRVLNISNNLIYGSIPRSMGQVNPKTIDVSNNKLTGDASLLFGRNKTRVRSIKLSQNGFKFDLSKVYFPLTLVQLNMSNNMIYGSLPEQLGKLSFRSFDVSYNQLCGLIPNSTHLTRFSPVRFAHNKCLCGNPLPACK